MKIRARGCMVHRDTLAFSFPHLSFQVLSSVRPSSWTWTRSCWRDAANYESKSNLQNVHVQDKNLWSLSYNSCNLLGGSRAGTICVLLPCQASVWSDGTPAAVSHRGGQVSGAADQVWECLLLGWKRRLL